MTGLRPVWRFLLIWMVASLTLVLVDWLLPGFHIEGTGAAVAAAALLGLLNSLVWPVLVRLVLPLTVITLGLAPLVLNAAMVGVVAWALDAVTLDNLWWGLAVAAAMTFVLLSRKIQDPVPPDPTRPFDTLGATLSAAGLICVVSGILQADNNLWLMAGLMATVRSTTNPPSREQLLTEVALEVQGMTQQKQNPLSDFKLAKGIGPGPQVLEELRTVCGIVQAKASQEEYDAFRRWLVTTAEAAAESAKEGGFMGFGAVQVSRGEQAMLEQLRSELDLGPTS